MELKEADEQLELKMQEFKQKQLAIEKVAARAERERNRSMFLKEEIVSMLCCESFQGYPDLISLFYFRVDHSVRKWCSKRVWI